MDWTVELHPDDGGAAKMIDLPNFEAVLTCIREHKENGLNEPATAREWVGRIGLPSERIVGVEAHP